MKFLIFILFILLFCLTAFAQPLLRGPFTTNTAFNQYVLSTNIALTVAENATNSASVTNWINSRQPSNAVISNQVGLATQAFTNTINPAVSNLTTTNITVCTGASTSNSFVGGTVYYTTVSFTNLNGASTMSNLANVSIPGHSITNNGDSLIARWTGIMPSPLVNTNRFLITWGGTTVLDTGLMIASNTVFRAELTVTRTGTSAQHVDAHLDWGPGGLVPFAFTNANLETTINTGVAQTIALQGGARRVGAHTNNYFRVEFRPGPR